LILNFLEVTCIGLLVGAAGVLLLVAARGIRCGMRWAYTTACALSVVMAMYSAFLGLPGHLRFLADLIFVQFALIPASDLIRELGWLGILFLGIPPILHLGAILLAALAILAIARPYWIKRRHRSAPRI